ncbi:hypothetical protein BKA70DRAFT_1287996 [Coprinopsis sp. MPI-PUGE-AT-0042]|nr:hypothetical protein BKA70DRAFT_1287996 [Coprinopsis sp. MPI-PUGE-AT-0042]
MATCPDTSLLHHTLSNGTEIFFCGLPFDSSKTCGFLERDAAIGVQLCCAVTEAIRSSEAICHYSVGERVGQLMEVLASFATGIAVGGLLVYALYRKVRTRLARRHYSNQEHLRKTDAIDSYLFMNLLVAEFVQAIGNLLTIKWISQGFIVNEDPVCTAQGALKQIGIVLTALTAQTFYALVLRWPIRKSDSRWMILGLWTCVALDVGIPNAVHRNSDVRYYGSTGFWCWVVPFFKTEQIVTEYLYMWIAAFFMLILYVAMFVVLKGYASFEDGSIRWGRKSNGEESSSARSTPNSDQYEDETESKDVAKMLLLYPAVYMFSIVPITIARWMQFSGHRTPYQATLFSATVFALAGFFNVILFWVTRPELVTGGVTDAQPALPNPMPNLLTVPVPESSEKGGASPQSPPLHLRTISTGNERDDGENDYGLAPL